MLLYKLLCMVSILWNEQVVALHSTETCRRMLLGTLETLSSSRKFLLSYRLLRQHGVDHEEGEGKTKRPRRRRTDNGNSVECASSFV